MVFKNEKTGKWEVRCYYKDYTGKLRQKTKRGFRTKGEALDWERHFKLKGNQDLNMTLNDFFELYKRDVEHMVRANTWEEKENIITTKVLPYLGERKINELIVEPKSRHDEKTYKKYQKVYVMVSDLKAKRDSAYSRKNQLETKLSIKDYKLIGGKKKLQTEIQSLENEIKGISSKINKAVKEVGEDSLRDFESHYRYLERLKENHEYGKKRLAEAKLHHEDRVKEYMADVKELNVELQERDRKYVRSR